MSRKKADKSVYVSFGNRLSSKITRKSTFAEAVGVSYETVRVWCKGKSLPDVHQLLGISSFLDVSIDWLLTGREKRDNFGYAWPDEVKVACQELARILLSRNEPLKQAILANLAVFKLALEQEERIENLEREVVERRKRESRKRSDSAAQQDPSGKRKAK